MKNFIKNLFLKDQPESSKRFFGGLGMVVSIVYVGFYPSNIDTLIYASTALLGIGILDKMKTL